MNNNITPAPVKVTFADCKEYADTLAAGMRHELSKLMAEHGIAQNCVFADIWAQPILLSCANPYHDMMNMLKQFAHVAWGGYEATAKAIALGREVERLRAMIGATPIECTQVEA